MFKLDVQERWPEIEPGRVARYAINFGFRWRGTLFLDEAEHTLVWAGDREAIISYAKSVLRGRRSLVFEQYFENNPEYSAAFKKYCDLVDWSRPDTGPINGFVAKRMKRWFKAGSW